MYALPQLSGANAVQTRALQLGGRIPTDGYLLRSPSSLGAPLRTTAGVRWQILAPELAIAHNSEIPLSMNDGFVWAGRGTTVRIMAGIRARSGPFVLVFAPQWMHVGNGSFLFPPIEKPDRSPMQVFWRFGYQSADLPIRFGSVSYSQFDLGQSFFGVRTRPVVFGVSTENEWWGPGVRNALILSDNAQGIPRVVLRSGEPIRTRVGDFEARLESGVLTESLYFDSNSSNDRRSFNAVGFTFRPRIEPGLTVGIARSIAGRLPRGRSDVLEDVPDLFTAPSGDNRIDLRSFFARWVFPKDGFEVYGEWLFQSAPEIEGDASANADDRSWPGYTLGIGWVRPLSSDSSWSLHLGAEVTDLENRTAGTISAGEARLYVNPGVLQGYTQRGQSIGAAIGPGSSSQWLGVDLFLPRGRIGAGLERVRWNTDAFYTQFTGWSFIAHDVSVMPSVRAALHLGDNLIVAEVIRERRLNFLFQNWATNFEDTNRVDFTNLSARLFVRFAP